MYTNRGYSYACFPRNLLMCVYFIDFASPYSRYTGPKNSSTSLTQISVGSVGSLAGGCGLVSRG